jgi:hypothetical protein
MTSNKIKDVFQSFFTISKNFKASQVKEMITVCNLWRTLQSWLKREVKRHEVYNKDSWFFGFIELLKWFESQPFDVIEWKEKAYRIKHSLNELLESPGIVEQQLTKETKTWYMLLAGFSCK